MSSIHPLLALSLDLPIRILAVIGCFTLGAIIGNQIFKLVANPDPKSKLHQRVTWIIRTLSGVVLAYIAALFLFGGGGVGVGGSGGFGIGSGVGSGESNKPGVGGDKEKNEKMTDPKDKGKKPPEKEGIETGEEASPLRIEVLGDAPLKKLSKKDYSPEKRFRSGGAGGELYTIGELQKVILSRIERKPPLKKVVIIIYRDSPDINTEHVTSLQRWAQDLGSNGKGKLEVEITFPDSYAPVE